MKKGTLAIFAFFVLTGFLNAQEAEKKSEEKQLTAAQVVDIEDAQKRVNELTEESNKMTAEINNLKKENDAAKSQMDENDKTVSKIEGLIERINKENTDLKNQTDVVIDRDSHNIATETMQKNEQTKEKLVKLMKKLKSDNRGHELTTKFRLTNIDSNTEKIGKNSREIQRLNLAMKKSTDLKTDIKGHASNADKIQSEADSILKGGDSTDKKGGTTPNTDKGGK
jgi:chromosome segregation ATPase